MQWIECERCLHISPNPYGQRAPMKQPSKTANLRAAPDAAARLEDALIDADLEAVIQAWAELPESVKRAVMEMVRVYSSSGGS